LDHRHYLRAELHRARNRKRVLDAHFSRDQRSEKCGQQLERVPVTFGMKWGKSAKKYINTLDLRKDLCRTIAPQIGMVVDVEELVV
jgi:hypothetical protein